MSVEFSQVAIVGASLGVISHLGYFIRGEHLRGAPLYFLCATLGPLVLAFMLVRYAQLTLLHAVAVTGVGYITYMSALFTSMAIYRVFFHPLRNFPGPKKARITQWYYSTQTGKNCDNFRYLDRLHAQYGDYVRVGPNLLSVADPDWVEPIHNRQTTFIKAEWYDIGQPMTTLHQMRDKSLHDQRRRHGWDKAFTTASLRSYDSRLTKYANLLVSQLAQRSGQTVNATDWFNWLAFDIMGDLAFGRAFKALESGESHFYIKMIHQTNELGGGLGTLPWLLQTTMLIPTHLNPLAKVITYSKDCMQERKKREPKEQDVMSHILGAGPFFHESKRDDLLLTGDARLLIVAGSDTTATTLIHTFYHFAKDSSHVEKIREELAESHIRNDDESLNPLSLQNLPYLNAVINETLRLHPPVPGGVYRMTPPEGVIMAGQKLPGGVKIIGPHHTIQRSPKAFTKPTEFIPERWTTQHELILNKDAFFPFSMGKFSCIGKQLALNELRVVIAKVLLEFDVKFAEGETGKALLEDSKDVFTLNNARLELCFTKRTE
ncbi:cytochrome P450 monooxygenase-like protein [Xylariales sp. PMI_506]|nr:cytochrome P450 monooxygenase-like protein [Xylariales sp. PMI_506]